MAKKIKFYKSGGVDPTRDSIIANSAGNVPSGYKEISRQQATNIVKRIPTFRIIGGEINRKQLLSGATPQGKYVTDPTNGNITTQKKIKQREQQIAGVKAGTLKEISPGMFIPVGSPAVTPQSAPVAQPQGNQTQPPKINLQPGSKGNDVKQLQNYLVSQGYMTQAEMNTGPGIYGPRTKKAVTALQKAQGVDNTTGVGFYGPRTRAGITQQPTPTQTPPQQIPQDLLNFNQAIVNKDYGALNAMGASQPQPADVTSLQTGQVPLTPYTTPEPRAVNGGGVPTIQKQPEVLPETAKEKQSRTLFEQAQGLLGKTGGEAQAQIDAEKQFGIQEIEKQRQNILNRIKATDVQATEEKSRAENRLAPTLAITGEQAAIDRAIAVKQLKLNAQFQAVSGDLTQALDYADRAVAAEFNPIKEKLDRTLRNLNLLSAMPDLTQAERQQVEDRKALVAERQTSIEEAKQEELVKRSKILDFIAGGADEATQRELEQAGTLEEAYRIASDAGLFRPSGKRLSVSEAKALNVPFGTTEEQAFGITPSDVSNVSDISTGEYASIIDSAANLVGSKRGQTSRASMNRAIQNGDFASAYTQMANNVEESLTGNPKIKFSNARTDMNVMLGMRKAIQDYAAQGGDLGLLKGTASDISAKLGRSTGNSQLDALNVQLKREFQTYRNNMTGAAFTPAESREYAAVNPRATASIDLNLSTIDGALAQLENRVRSTINTRVSGADKLYEAAGGSVIPQQQTQSLASLGISSEDENIFDSTVENSTSQTGGFWSNLWKGITGK